MGRIVYSVRDYLGHVHYLPATTHKSQSNGQIEVLSKSIEHTSGAMQENIPNNGMLGTKPPTITTPQIDPLWGSGWIFSPKATTIHPSHR